LARPKEAERKDLRPLVLSAAGELFVAQGYQSVTMRKIAQKAGCTPAAIYTYFSSKEEILFTLHNEAFKRLFEYSSRGLDRQSMDAMDRLRLSGRNYVDFALENPALYDLMFNLPEPREYLAKRQGCTPDEDCPQDESSPLGGVYPSMEDHGLRSYGYLIENVKLCQEAGYFTGADPNFVAFTLWSLVHGAVSLLLRNRGPIPDLPARQAAYQVVDFIAHLNLAAAPLQS
jgi:AcrR family transcriptional regulator